MANKRIILVTGASSGFGRAIALRFAAGGWDIIITGRRAERLSELKGQIEADYGVDVLPLCFDVQDRKAVNEQLANLPAEWQEIDVLVNNAGLALGRANFDEADIDDWETMIDTNIKGLLYVSRGVLPYFEKKGKGHIVNIGSTAAKDVYPMGNVYCATKSAVEAISKAQRIDLLSKKIKVTAIHPGAAETEFSLVRLKGNQAESDKVYAGYHALEARDIADITYYVANQPAHVCINDLVVTCTAQANGLFTYKEG
ncbi:SDR family NAD(P)-dependent oxidoreductase [Arachidicoccus terrestris]|uniref:SDR family NAD(P)-dependent oxidoreductase n=1 Tax=Arachidicoccus terrestris TaxID=2875539 RepID=UPI001CC407A5|nr:SDR family NAD(P)-dependent oxidoreductase [Arachidicoccus terrestris]UAY54412.1 SDR family NAD(P)-dependent oxidoreductase [Arachidicoccus terrestris]